MKNRVRFLVAFAVTAGGAVIGTALTVSILEIPWNKRLFLANLLLMAFFAILIYIRKDLTKTEIILGLLAAIIYLAFAMVFNLYEA